MSERLFILSAPPGSPAAQRVLGLTPLARHLHELQRAGLVATRIEAGRFPDLETAAAELSREAGAPVTVIAEAAVFRRGALPQLLSAPLPAGERLRSMVRGRTAICRTGGSPGDGSPERDRTEDISAICCVLDEPADLEAAARLLLDGLRKPMLVDGIVGYYVMRPITLRITSLLAGTRVRPNHVTAFCLLLGLASAGLIWTAASPLVMSLGVFLYFAGATLDCVDGELSRLKYMGSLKGAWFDTLSDDISTTLLLLALGVYLHRTTGHAWHLWLGLAGAGSFAIGALYVYHGLLTVFHSGDVLDFVWAFQRGSKEARSGPIDYLLLLAKRDFFSAFLAVCAFAGGIRFGATIVSAACVCYTALVVFDLAVVLTRGGRRRQS